MDYLVNPILHRDVFRNVTISKLYIKTLCLTRIPIIGILVLFQTQSIYLPPTSLLLIYIMNFTHNNVIVN